MQFANRMCCSAAVMCSQNRDSAPDTEHMLIPLARSSMLDASRCSCAAALHAAARCPTPARQVDSGMEPCAPPGAEITHWDSHTGVAETGAGLSSTTCRRDGGAGCGGAPPPATRAAGFAK